MNLKKIKYIIVTLVLPVSTFAQSNFDLNAAGTNFDKVISYVLGIIYILLPIMTSVAFVFFFWGLSKFILNSNKPDDIKNGKKYMLWAILALFVLLTFRTIITLVSTDLQFGGSGYLIPFLRGA